MYQPLAAEMEARKLAMQIEKEARAKAAAEKAEVEKAEALRLQSIKQKELDLQNFYKLKEKLGF